MKPDALALFLTALGLLVFARNEDGWKRNLSLLFFIAAFFVKQSYLAAPLAACVYLLIRDRKIPWLFTFLGVGMLIFIVALLEFVVFRSGAFLKHFVFYNAAPFDGLHFTLGMINLFGTLVILIVAGMAAVRRRIDLSLFSCHFAVAAVFALLSVGKDGSDVNYWMETWLAGIFVFGRALMNVPEERKRFNVLTASCVAAGLLVLGPYPRLLRDFRIPAIVAASNAATFAKIGSDIALGSTLMSDFPEFGALTPVRHRVLLDLPFVFNFMKTLQPRMINPNLLKDSADRNVIDVWISETVISHPAYALLYEAEYYDVVAPKHLFVYRRR